MKDHIVRQTYDRGYDAGVLTARSSVTAVNPYKRARALRSYSRHEYWQMGYDDGLAGKPRKLTQGEADDRDRKRLRELEALRPNRTFVCLCGSTRFSQAFRDANLRETLAGRIVLTIGCEWHSDQALGLTEDDKADLDALHLDKIQAADEVLILNVGGYVGESTRREIAHARKLGKRIRWLEPDKALEPELDPARDELEEAG